MFLFTNFRWYSLVLIHAYPSYQVRQTTSGHVLHTYASTSNVTVKSVVKNSLLEPSSSSFPSFSLPCSPSSSSPPPSLMVGGGDGILKGTGFGGGVLVFGLVISADSSDCEPLVEFVS